MADYKILEKLGEGGMGVVHRAIQQPLGREVALKRLHPGGFGEEALKKRFLHEIQALMRLSHPAVIRVYDAGTMDGGLYYSMEFIKDARALSQVIKVEGPLDAERSLGLVAQMLEGLVVVHDAGMVHRDIKPSNVLLTGEDRVLLMDFGLVKDSQATALTSPGDLLGSLPYIAPEMLLGEPAGPMSDIWAVGVVLFELVTRRNAFQGNGMEQLIRAIVHLPAPRAIELRPELPQPVQDLLDRLMQKEIPLRAASAGAALEAVRECQAWFAEEKARFKKPKRDTGHVRASDRVSRKTASAPAVPAGQAVETSAIRPRGRAGAAIIAGGLACALLALGMMRGLSPTPGTSVSSPIESAASSASPAASTRRPALDVLRSATRALRQLSPYTQLRTLARDFDQSLKGKSSRVPDPAMVRRWESRLNELRTGCRLDEVVDELTDRRPEVALDPGVKYQDMVEFHRALSDLEDLERLIDRLDIPWKAVARSLELPGHRFEDRSAKLVGNPAGIAYRMTIPGSKIGAEEPLDTDPGVRTVPIRSSAPFETFVDPRDPADPGAFDLGAGTYTDSTPLDAGTRGATRIDFLMSSSMLEGSFRLLVSKDPKAPASRWEPIARFRSPGTDPAWVGHSVPASLLEEPGLHMRIELVPDHGSFLDPKGVGQARGYLWAVLFRKDPGVRLAEGASTDASPSSASDLRPVLESTLAALTKLDARSLIVRMHREFQKVYEIDGDGHSAALPLRNSWKMKQRHALEGSQVVEWVERLKPHLGTLRAQVATYREENRRLYSIQQDLHQMERVGLQVAVPFPDLSSALRIPGYEPTKAGEGHPVSGVSLIFTHNEKTVAPPLMKPVTSLTSISTAFGNPFEIMKDPLDSDFAGTWEVASGYAWVEVPIRAPMGRNQSPSNSLPDLDWVGGANAAPRAPTLIRARIQLDVRMLTPRTGFRIFTAPAHKAPFSTWKLIAHLEAEDPARYHDTPMLLEHILPSEFFEVDPQYLVISLSYDHAGSIGEKKSVVSRGALREFRIVFEEVAGK